MDGKKKREKSCFARLGINIGWVYLFFFCEAVNEKSAAQFLFALERPAVISSAGRTV